MRDLYWFISLSERLFGKDILLLQAEMRMPCITLTHRPFSRWHVLSRAYGNQTKTITAVLPITLTTSSKQLEL